MNNYHMENGKIKSIINYTDRETAGQLVNDLAIYLAVQIISFLLSSIGSYCGAGGMMIASGLFLFIVNYKRWKFVLDLRGLLSLSWICGEGLACLKLSNLSSDWSVITWIACALAYVCFRIGYYLVDAGIFRRKSCTVSINEDSSKIAEDSSEIAEDSSEIAEGPSEIAGDSSEIAGDSSEIAEDSSEIAEGPSEIAEDSSEIAEDPSEIAEGSSEIAGDPSEIAGKERFVGYAQNGEFSFNDADKMRTDEDEPSREHGLINSDWINRRLLCCIIAVTIVSAAAFVLEALVLGFIPIFSEEPHAYSYFHISGVHYFTVCFTFVPALFLIYMKSCGRKNVKLSAWICLVISLILPILCVSRFQLIFAVGLGIAVYLALYQDIRKKYLFIILILMIALYVALTVLRHHDVEYLNGIFEMKNSDMPIFITQPYMYVANNFENFNCLVRNLVKHTFGVRMAYPLWALTGLKFKFPQLTDFPVYITKTELTTLTWIYDFYYDFGLVGVGVFTGLLGSAGAFLTRVMGRSRSIMTNGKTMEDGFAIQDETAVKAGNPCDHGMKSVSSDTGSTNKNSNPIAVLYFGQFAIYTVLSFFTTWWSNPTAWFWLGVTTILFIVMQLRRKNDELSGNQETADC